MSAHYDRGVQLYNLGRHKEAVTYFKNALAEDPNNFYAQYHLALSYHQLDDVHLFEATTKSLLALNASHPEVHYLYSILCHEKDDISNAIKHIDMAISLYPSNSNYFGKKALILLDKKDFEQALEVSNEGLALNPKDKICLNSRTKALTKLNKKEEAFETMENTLADNPEDYFTHANAGWSNLELGNYKKANEHFREALHKNPNEKYARDGMLESIKAKNPIYRYFLKYVFWMNNKSSNFQWGFIIGLYLLYRFSSKLADNFGFNFLLPIIAILYFTFVLGSWLITPISNTILLFDNYGKHLLDKQDKNSAYGFICIFSIAILSSITYYLVSDYKILFITVASFCSLIPISVSLLNDKSLFKNIGFWYGVIIFVLGFINLTYPISLFVPIGMFAIFTWFSSFLNNE